MDWLDIKENTPPDERVRVKDEFDNEGIADPTYYPFKVVKMAGDERKPYGWRGTPIPCDNHWDGGWMVLADKGLSTDIKGKIIAFQKI